MDPKKTLIILDHPNFDQSNVHRRFVEEMRKYPDEFLIHNLQSAYPTGKIDPSKEHCLIDNNGTVVLEFPFYWFNCPPKTKEWFDKVITSEWAFKNGHHLKGKKVALAISCGSEEAAYTKEGRHHRTAEEYLSGFLRAFEMCEADYQGMFALYGINDREIVTADAIGQAAREYVSFLKKLKTD
ncbi:MAG: NAD(P)H-dependent oxidoreductase [Succinivibrio sp.]